MYRLLQRFWIWRWLATGRALIGRVRVHPSALMLGRRRQIQISAGAKVGARTILDAGVKGRIVIAPQVWISSDVGMQTETVVAVGAGTSIQQRCNFNGTVRIGCGCIFAPNVFVSSGTHPFRSFPALPIREQERRIAASGTETIESADRAVWIQDDCWLGVNAVVCPGVTVGRGSVIGANSVVTRDVAPYSVVAGAPAKPIGARLVWSPPLELDFSLPEHDVYVLEGVREENGFAVDPISRCFTAALAAKSLKQEVDVHYSAACDLEFSCDDGAHQVKSGVGALRMNANQVLGGGIFRLRIAGEGAMNSAALCITKIVCH